MSKENSETIPQPPHLDGVIKALKQNMKMGPELLPTFFLTSPAETIIVCTPFESNTDKDMIAMMIRKMAREKNVTSLAFVSESWMVDTDYAQEFMDNRDKYPNVSDFPHKHDIVMIMYEGPDGNAFGRATVFQDRSIGEIEWIKSTGMDGRFANLLPRQTTDDGAGSTH